MKKINIYADGADYEEILKLKNKSLIKGFTTNPSLMRKSGVKNYKNFAKKLIKNISKPISFEVFSDDLKGMSRQAEIINSWGKNIYVKIPIVNSKGKSTIEIIKKLNKKNIKLNITAVFTLTQVKQILNNINKNADLIISIFAGRIADTGRDPVPVIKDAIKLKKNFKKVKILWASTREVLNIYQAEKINCDIITVPNNMLKKISLKNKNLNKYSIETSRDFYIDGKKSKFNI